MGSLTDSSVREIVPGVVRLGTVYVGWYVLAEGGRLTVVDAAVPGYWGQLVSFLDRRGAALADIEAVLLTHHHDDHRGNAERLRLQADAEVMIHQLDREPAMSRGRPPRAPLWRTPVLRYILHLLRNGIARTTPVAEASSFDDGEVLDLPGRPRVVHTPGHTGGNCALFLEDQRALITGDTLVTMDFSGAAGPRIAASFTNADSEEALASLSRIEELYADWILPMHGNPWEGTPHEAVRQAREVGVH